MLHFSGLKRLNLLCWPFLWYRICARSISCVHNRAMIYDSIAVLLYFLSRLIRGHDYILTTILEDSILARACASWSLLLPVGWLIVSLCTLNFEALFSLKLGAALDLFDRYLDDIRASRSLALGLVLAVRVSITTLIINEVDAETLLFGIQAITARSRRWLASLDTGLSDVWHLRVSCGRVTCNVWNNTLLLWSTFRVNFDLV